jgi:hypothetical protein
MGWYEEFQKAIGEAAQQIKGSGQPVPTTASPRSGEVFFKKTRRRNESSGDYRKKTALMCIIMAPL